MPPSAAAEEALLEWKAQACPVQAPLQVPGEIVQAGMRLAVARRSLQRGQDRLWPAWVQPQDPHRSSQEEGQMAPHRLRPGGRQQEDPQGLRRQRLGHQGPGSRRHPVQRTARTARGQPVLSRPCGRKPSFPPALRLHQPVLRDSPPPCLLLLPGFAPLAAASHRRTQEQLLSQGRELRLHASLPGAAAAFPLPGRSCHAHTEGCGDRSFP